MNTSSKSYASGATTMASHASDTLADAARGAVNSVKTTVGDAVDRGQAALSQARAAAGAVDYFNGDPVVHTWTYKLDKAA